ncbi:YkgJ family cysteine cluster protein [Dehalococcoides mccartyi]|uniref:YkgJ family cysteine cluster protein n=1 Tax=Dehalococcoides mccartyi TaxID=61435 RepID=A0AB38ZBQ6_9CHLR|nr:YkgJ family cysteine cluster protein [Dehalococcoides mccartyi]WRO08005.1 YkgJ family cysteine cluster protein [Dehalococcoides mccartyi]
MQEHRSFMSNLSSSDISNYRALTAEYESYCREQAGKHFMASKFNFKKCQCCGYCCLCYPCMPRPDEISPVAEYLNISVKELIDRYMVVDTADCQTFFLRWAKAGQEDITGARIPPRRTYDRGYCIFFDKDKKTCCIHPVRPDDAKIIKCWDDRQSRDKKLWGMTSWKQTDIYRFIPDFSPNYFKKSKEKPI